ncbi:MAG: hypothetical protein LDL39_08985 [Magnetospirillum sp.]|nr:hypothetical protein [Magnetospirillum sp.]
MTHTPAIGAAASAITPTPGTTAVAPTIQDSRGSEDKNRAQAAVAIALVQDRAEILWQAKHGIANQIEHRKQHDGLDEAERHRIQRQVAALAVHSAPTLSGREAVARQMQTLRHGLNAQDVAVLTRKTAIALEANPLSLTGTSRESSLRRVF